MASRIRNSDCRGPPVSYLFLQPSCHLTISCLRLTTWGQGGEGRIRLSVDDGPSAREFLDDDYDEDNERLGDDEPLAVTAQRLRDVGPPAEPSTEPVAQSTLVFETETEEPPPPPAKP